MLNRSTSARALNASIKLANAVHTPAEPTASLTGSLLLAQSVVVDRLGAVLAVVVWTAQLAAAVVGAEPEERADGALGAAFALTVLGVAAACCVAHGRPRDAVAATLAAWLLLMGAAYWGAPHDVAVALAAAAALTAATLPLMAGRGAEPPVVKEL